MKCVDLGCGVGGPARNIARFSKAHITGVNCNTFQISRAKLLTEQQPLVHVPSFVEADFMKLPFEANTYDSAYHFEALCHTPDTIGLYAEIFRVLKPGGRCAGTQWLMTPKYDPNNKTHVDLKFVIERGNGVPDIGTIEVFLRRTNKEKKKKQTLVLTRISGRWPPFRHLLTRICALVGAGGD